MEHGFSIFVLLVGFGLGYMLGRWNGFRDADEVFDEEVDKIKSKWVPKRDARGRFVKRK